MTARTRKRRMAYCRWAGVSAVLAALVFLAIFILRAGLGPGPAFACPPPAVWDSYPPIGCNALGQDVTNEISVPLNGTSYYLGHGDRL